MPPNNSIFYIIKHHSTVHTKQCLYIIPYFRVFCKRVTHIFLKIFIAVELGAFLHRRSGVLELRQRVRPNGAAPFPAPADRGARTASACSPFPGGAFSAPAERGTRTALACSPLTGGEFFAEPQRGDSPSADGGSVAAPTAGAKRKDNLRFSFLFELLPFPCFLIWRRLPTCDRFEKEYGRGSFLPCLSQPVRSVRCHSATQAVKFPQAQHTRVAQLFNTL